MATQSRPKPAETRPKPAVKRENRLLAPVREVGELATMSFSAARSLTSAPRYSSEVLRQASDMFRRTSLLQFVMAAFIGMSTVNAAYFFLRSIGASDFLGAVSGFGTPRLLSTTMFGYVFTSAVCCAMTAEIGAMRINQEIEAYDSTGVDPMRFVVATRLMAVIIYAPIAALLSLLGVLGGVYFGSVILLHGIAGSTLLQLNWSVQSVNDQLFAIVTMSFTAVVTATIACFYGLRARGGPAAVGDAVARGLVINLVVLHLIAASFAVAFYGTDIRLPFGG